MSYTLTIEPEIVKEAESCAIRNGTTLDAMIRACLLVLVARDGINGAAQARRNPVTSGIKIGSMKGEVKLPDNFDEAFDSLDDEVGSMFMGAMRRFCHKGIEGSHLYSCLTRR